MLYLNKKHLSVEKEVRFMFSYVHLENFKSFKNITFDFHKNKREAKKMIAIYGENGSGKSNFVSAFDMLWMFLFSLPNHRIDDGMQRFIALLKKSSDGSLDQKTIDSLIDSYGIKTNIPSFLEKCRTVECSDPTVVEFGFILNSVEGHYTVKFSDQILFEELYYLDNKRRTNLFTVSLRDNKIQADLSKVTANKSYRKDIHELVSKYWGKYSLWSILTEEIVQKNYSYITEKINHSVLEVMQHFMTTSASFLPSVPNVAVSNSSIQMAFPVKLDIDTGSTPVKNEKYLHQYEQLLTGYLSQLCPDVVEAHYAIKYQGNDLFYELFLRKRIAGQIKEISIHQESTGTRKLIDELKPIVNVLYGFVSVYDEIDSNIHDLLMKNLLSSLADHIPEGGQLIFTTHNTLLLEAIDPNFVYIINIDRDGSKEVNCCNDYDYKRIQQTNNLRNMYLKGMFGGIPYSSDIDFSFADSMNEKKSEDGTEGDRG